LKRVTKNGGRVESASGNGKAQRVKKKGGHILAGGDGEIVRWSKKVIGKVSGSN